MEATTKIRGDRELEREIRKLEPNSFVLFIIKSEKYHKVNLQILKMIIKTRKFSGIYITVNKPYPSLIRYLKKGGVPTEKIFFIDCISKTVGGEIKLTEDCLFIPSPTRLTDLGIALSQALEAMKIGKNKFLFLDSLSTLLIYNDFKTVAQFVHYLASRLRLFGLVGILMTIEKQIDEKMLYLLIEICDKIIEVK